MASLVLLSSFFVIFEVDYVAGDTITNTERLTTVLTFAACAESCDSNAPKIVTNFYFY